MEISAGKKKGQGRKNINICIEEEEEKCVGIRVMVHR